MESPRLCPLSSLGSLLSFRQTPRDLVIGHDQGRSLKARHLLMEIGIMIVVQAMTKDLISRGLRKKPVLEGVLIGTTWLVSHKSLKVIRRISKPLDGSRISRPCWMLVDVILMTRLSSRHSLSKATPISGGRLC
jgi:hypothetical protein